MAPGHELKQIFNLLVNLRNHKIYSCNDQRDITSIELGVERDETINGGDVIADTLEEVALTSSRTRGGNRADRGGREEGARGRTLLTGFHHFSPAYDEAGNASEKKQYGTSRRLCIHAI